MSEYIPSPYRGIDDDCRPIPKKRKRRGPTFTGADYDNGKTGKFGAARGE